MTTQTDAADVHYGASASLKRQSNWMMIVAAVSLPFTVAISAGFHIPEWARASMMTVAAIVFIAGIGFRGEAKSHEAMALHYEVRADSSVAVAMIVDLRERVDSVGGQPVGEARSAARSRPAPPEPVKRTVAPTPDERYMSDVAEAFKLGKLMGHPPGEPV